VSAGAAGTDPRVEIVCPTDATARINAILSGRRGQIRRFDTVKAGRVGSRPRHDARSGDRRPDRRMRSATPGRRQFYPAVRRMAEVTGRAADQIIAAHRVAA